MLKVAGDLCQALGAFENAALVNKQLTHGILAFKMLHDQSVEMYSVTWLTWTPNGHVCRRVSITIIWVQYQIKQFVRKMSQTRFIYAD